MNTHFTSKHICNNIYYKKFIKEFIKEFIKRKL